VEIAVPVANATGRYPALQERRLLVEEPLPSEIRDSYLRMAAAGMDDARLLHDRSGPLADAPIDG
jgi:hypothetical protein